MDISTTAPFAAWPSSLKQRHQSLFSRRMMADYVWKNELTEEQRVLCGGEAGRLRVKGWVTSLDCHLEKQDIIGLFMVLSTKQQ